jgi:S-DNA-T family DNA segregation ATPase FtsK/SpoIIIE
MQEIEQLNNIFADLNINAKCFSCRKHRHFAFYDVKLGAGTKIKKIESSSREIALGLLSKSNPIISSVPEEGILRIKTTFKSNEVIDFNNLLQSHKNKLSGILPLLLGETDYGEPLWLDMADMPHLLISGTSGSGKSTLLHTIISNVINLSNTWLYLIDPKRVEFNKYTKASVIGKSYKDAISILELLNTEMESRYNLLSSLKKNSIEQCPELFSRILLIIDEVSDLMIQDKNNKFETLLINLAQKSRAAGIYIILSTQRPSVDVITGLIKANFPARIACKVSSSIDSKVILDQIGAESLIGRGDAIIFSPKHNYVRFQVALVT